MARYRKAIVGGLTACVQYFLFRETPMPPEVEAFIGTVVTLALVYVVPNKPGV